MDIILYLLNIIQYQQKQIRWLLKFICRYIPLKQRAFDDSHSPKYRKRIVSGYIPNANSGSRTGNPECKRFALFYTT